MTKLSALPNIEISSEREGRVHGDWIGLRPDRYAKCHVFMVKGNRGLIHRHNHVMLVEYEGIGQKGLEHWITVSINRSDIEAHVEATEPAD